MANIVPEKAINFSVYLNGSELLGVAEGNFPSGDMMTSETRGAGIAGVVDSIVLGHLNSTTIELSWRNVTPQFSILMEHEAHSLDLYASHQDFNAGSGMIETRSIHVYMKAITKNYNIGKLVVGNSSETKTTHEVYYLKYYENGREQLEIDKYNFIYKVNGVDYLASVRRDLGKM